MEDQVLEDLQFHQETVESDANSPLHLIREKEIEISGRVLQAKREADEIIAEARRKGAEIIGAAENEGSDAVAGRREAVEAEAAEEAEKAEADAKVEVEQLAAKIAGRREQAVDLVLDAIARV